MFFVVRNVGSKLPKNRKTSYMYLQQKITFSKSQRYTFFRMIMNNPAELRF